jgi:hypothetical protein
MKKRANCTPHFIGPEQRPWTYVKIPDSGLLGLTPSVPANYFRSIDG